MGARFDEPRQHLPLAELDRVVLEPILSPLPTVVEAVRDVMSDRPPTVLTLWQRRMLRATMPRRELRALTAFRPTAVPSDGGPNELLETVAGAAMRDELERLAASDADQLGLTIEQATKAGRPTAPWMVVHRDPGGWLEDYIGALRRVWAELQPQWWRGRGRLEREIDRIQGASDTHTGAEVLIDAEIPGRIEDGQLALPSHTDQSGRLRVAGTLQLVPLLAARPAGSWGDDDADRLLSVRYPLPAEGVTADEATSPESLDALLGGPRAAILLALEQPLNPGRMAEQLFLTPSGVTHHLSALEAAGLVTRTREGRNVLVRRTDRANALLALYDLV